MKFFKDEMKVASEVSHFMMDCVKIDKERYYKATECGIPHGDMAYGQALVDWIKKGKPENAWFSYAPGQVECKLLIAFRKEISAKFGLEIMTSEEGEKRRKRQPGTVITTKVTDWGLN